MRSGTFTGARRALVDLVSWNDASGQECGAYVEADKDNFVHLLNTLSFRSQKPIYADSDDRKWLQTQGVSAKADPEEKQQPRD
jgi:hypothetical protein